METLKAYLDFAIAPGPLVVQEVKTMHGANYFSGGPIVMLRLDLGKFDEVFTNQIPGFYERLAAAVPSLAEHQCSEKIPGGFFVRVRKGTLLGHVVEHTAIELQTLAGMDVGYGKTRSTNQQGVYNVVFRFHDEVAGVYAGKAAVNCINALVMGQPFDAASVVNALVDIREKRMLGPSTQAIVDEAAARQIPCQRLDAYNLVQLGTGKYHKWVRATITSDTSLIAVETADDKFLTLSMLKDAGIPVPESVVSETVEPLLAFRESQGRPIVVKPARASAGQGVTIQAGTPEEVRRAFAMAQGVDSRVLAQPFIPGKVYRLLVIDDRFTAAVHLIPPYVIGDGRKTVGRLIEDLNADPRRGFGDKSVLTRVEVDEQILNLIRARGLTLESVPAQGEVLLLRISGSLRLGGFAVDVTDTVHPVNRFLAERAAKVLKLNVAGVDLVAQDIARSILETGGAVLEVNAAPDFRMHLRPTQGKPRPVAGPLVDMLFPPGGKTRIPLISVTGTLGKTTTVNLLAHCLSRAGHAVGVTSNEGLFIDGKCLMKGDMTYPEHVALVLKDPTIDCAVLETSREGILRRGLGYEYADFGIVLNIHDDHVGADDIRYLEDLAYAKSVVAEQVWPEGWAVLNADHELVLDMAQRVKCRLALFSHDDQHPRLQEHVQGGGLAAALDRDRIVLFSGRDRIPIAPLEALPLAFMGRAAINIDALLSTVAVLHAFGFSREGIADALASFHPTPEQLPGRMNMMRVGDFSVLLDYAHNRASFLSLKEFLMNFDEEKVGALDAAGDRSDEEIIQLGAIAGSTYNDIILYEGFDQRGRKDGEVLGLLKKGVLEAGFPADRLAIFTEPEAAWRSALKQGRAGRMIVLLSPRSEQTLKVIREFEKKP